MIEKHYLNQALEERLENKIGRLATMLKMSSQRVASLIKGVDDVKLSELDKISTWMKKPLPEILAECALKDRASRLPPKREISGS